MILQSGPQNTSSSTSYLVIGAGALGTYIGGSLSLAGYSVTFLERPETANELQQRGMRLDIAGKQQIIPFVNHVGTVKEALDYGPYTAAIFALKSYDTIKAIESMRTHIKRLPPFLCLQNGVDNEEVLEAALGRERVIAGTVTSSVKRNAAGDVTLERLRGVGIAAGYPLSEALVKTMNTANLNAHLYEHAKDMKWSKMLTNLLANASCAILDMTPGEIFSHPDLYRLEVTQIKEALAVMKALGFKVIDLPATPVRLLSLVIDILPIWLSRPLIQRSVSSGRGGKMPSFHIDLHSGSKHSEVDYLNGAVVRHGFGLRIPTPTNQLLTEVLTQLTTGELSPSVFQHQPQQLLSRWRQALKG